MKQILWLMLTLSVAGARAGEPSDKRMNTTNTMELATFGGGCFWCMEAVFERLDGVESVTSGYAGGKKDKPTYKAEDYHQDYCRNHPNAPYCAVVISPKLEKLKPKLAKP